MKDLQIKFLENSILYKETKHNWKGHMLKTDFASLTRLLDHEQI